MPVVQIWSLQTLAVVSPASPIPNFPICRGNVINSFEHRIIFERSVLASMFASQMMYIPRRKRKKAFSNQLFLVIGIGTLKLCLSINNLIPYAELYVS